jgi:hypothetical protein
VLHWFSNNGIGASGAGLLFDSAGNLLGTGSEGTKLCGVVFRLKRPARRGGVWVPIVLYTFQGSPDGRGPSASLIFDAAGNLYSTTVGGGSGNGDGTVFEVSP